MQPEWIWEDLASRYPASMAEEKYARLYVNDLPQLRVPFSVFHHRLNGLFSFMHEKRGLGGHFNADPSRELVELIAEVGRLQGNLKRVGVTFSINTYYQTLLDRCSQFLVRSGGSAIPDDLPEIALEEYSPIFASSEVAVTGGSRQTPLQLVGSGSFGTVHKFVDPEYGMTIARKKAAARLIPQELARFRQEYDLLRRMRFPYIVEVYRYNETDNSYTMEYCDGTLEDYISGSPDLSLATRKRVAQQFLYGLNYLHSQQVIHRDVSRTNVLVKRYHRSAVLVKLSDFGLSKVAISDLTETGESLKGTFIDPTLASFDQADEQSDIYSAGHVLSFLFSGRKHIGRCSTEVQPIIDRCVTLSRSSRYATVGQVLADVDAIGLTS